MSWKHLGLALLVSVGIQGTAVALNAADEDDDFTVDCTENTVTGHLTYSAEFEPKASPVEDASPAEQTESLADSPVLEDAELPADPEIQVAMVTQQEAFTAVTVGEEEQMTAHFDRVDGEWLLAEIAWCES